MWLALFALWLIAGDEKSRNRLHLLTHVTRGGCLDEYEAATKKCRHASTGAGGADADACVKAKAALRRCFAGNPEWFGKNYYADRPEWFLGDEKKHEKLYLTCHVAKGGCLNSFSTAMDKCRQASPGGAGADAEACVKATAALRKCFAGRPDWFGPDFMDRMDKGLDQDTKPTPEEIEEDERRGTYRWWTGVRRS